MAAEEMSHHVGLIGTKTTVRTVTYDVAIIGAGMAGLSAARTLRAAGLNVIVVDKGRGVGGRLATRRIGDARLDHGAQFFTVRGDDFRSMVDEAIAAEVVHVWCHGFSGDDGYPRFACAGGMTGLAKWMAADLAESGDLKLSTRIEHIGHDGSQWTLADDTQTVASAPAVIITAPVPQTLDLFAASEMAPDAQILEELQQIQYKPVLGLLVTLDSPSALQSPGAVQATEDDHFTFIADNVAKGVSTSPAVTFHANGAVSSQRWDDPEDVVIQDFLEVAKPWIGDAAVLEVELKRWRFAGPRQPHPERCVVAFNSPGLIVLGGDAFGGPKVEGAFNSGLACAQKTLVEREESN